MFSIKESPDGFHIMCGTHEIAWRGTYKAALIKLWEIEDKHYSLLNAFGEARNLRTVANHVAA